MSTLTPPNGGPIGGSKRNLGIAAKRQQIEQTLCIDRYLEVVGGLLIGANSNSLTLLQPPKVGISKLPFNSRPNASR